jgi:hypothetical protein
MLRLFPGTLDRNTGFGNVRRLRKTDEKENAHMFGGKKRWESNLCLGNGRVLLEDYRLVVERRFARPSDAERYAGGIVSTW